jgi:hypothetical protein
MMGCGSKSQVHTKPLDLILEMNLDLDPTRNLKLANIGDNLLKVT